MKSFYDLLEIAENASDNEIKDAYINMQNKYKTYLSNPLKKEKAEKILKKLDLAYSVLSDSERRKSYDKDLVDMRNNELLDNLKKNTDIYNEEQRKKEEEEQKLQQEKELREKQIKLEQIQKDKEKKLEYIHSQIEKQIQEQQKEFEEAKKNRKKQEEKTMASYKQYLRSQGLRIEEEDNPIKRKLIAGLVGIVLIAIIVLLFKYTGLKDIILNNEFVKVFYNP